MGLCSCWSGIDGCCHLAILPGPSSIEPWPLATWSRHSTTYSTSQLDQAWSSCSLACSQTTICFSANLTCFYSCFGFILKTDSSWRCSASTHWTAAYSAWPTSGRPAGSSSPFKSSAIGPSTTACSSWSVSETVPRSRKTTWPNSALTAFSSLTHRFATSAFLCSRRAEAWPASSGSPRSSLASIYSWCQLSMPWWQSMAGVTIGATWPTSHSVAPRSCHPLSACENAAFADRYSNSSAKAHLNQSRRPHSSRTPPTTRQSIQTGWSTACKSVNHPYLPDPSGSSRWCCSDPQTTSAVAANTNWSVSICFLIFFCSRGASPASFSSCLYFVSLNLWSDLN